MKKLLVAWIMTSALFVSGSAPVQSISVVYCEEDTIECKVQNCQTKNEVIKWEYQGSDQDKPLQDCAKLERELSAASPGFYVDTLLPVGAVVVIAGAVGLLYIRRRRQDGK